MVNSRDKLKKKNYMILIPGVILFILGFVLLSLVGSKPEGALGLISPLSTLTGVILITFGLLVN